MEKNVQGTPWTLFKIMLCLQDVGYIIFVETHTRICENDVSCVYYSALHFMLSVNKPHGFTYTHKLAMVLLYKKYSIVKYRSTYC